MEKIHKILKMDNQNKMEDIMDVIVKLDNIDNSYGQSRHKKQKQH